MDRNWRFKQLMQAGMDIHLSQSNLGGSVEHYYHFLFGYLVPLVLAYEEKLHSPEIKNIYVRSCAILDEHIISIGYQKIVILDKTAHEEMRLDSSSRSSYAANIHFIEVAGYDHPRAYCCTDFVRAASVLMARLDDEVRKIEQKLNAFKSEGVPNVVLIDRGAPHPFYALDASEIKSSGIQRRSIPNFSCLERAILSTYPNTLIAKLEQKSLAYQIALFRHADVVIAQHGAALANLIWCMPGTAVIEIEPRENGIQAPYFKDLAACMKLYYQHVDQQNSHDNVQVDSVLDKIP